MDELEILKFTASRLKYVEYKSLLKLISKLGIHNMIHLSIPKGNYISRIRPSTDIPFTKKSEISYRSNVSEYGRANRPNHPMFYGSFGTVDMQNPIITNTFEIIHIIVNGNYKLNNDSIELTFGKWKIIKDLPVVPMIFHEPYLVKLNFFRNSYKNYLKANKNSEKVKESINFIGSEFAKAKIESHHDYKITAAFTEYIFRKIENKIEAIIYPSVRSDGSGFNIALTPSYTDEYLKLESVFTMTLYLNDKLGLLDPDKIALSVMDDDSFKLEPVPYLTKGRDWCMKELNSRK